MGAGYYIRVASAGFVCYGMFFPGSNFATTAFPCCAGHHLQRRQPHYFIQKFKSTLKKVLLTSIELARGLWNE
jgi:hypothetical protein